MTVPELTNGRLNSRTESGRAKDRRKFRTQKMGTTLVSKSKIHLTGFNIEML